MDDEQHSIPPSGYSRRFRVGLWLLTPGFERACLIALGTACALVSIFELLSEMRRRDGNPAEAETWSWVNLAAMFTGLTIFIGCQMIWQPCTPILKADRPRIKRLNLIHWASAVALALFAAQVLYAQDRLDPVIAAACVNALLLACVIYMTGTCKKIEAIPPVGLNRRPLMFVRSRWITPRIVYSIVFVGALLGCTGAYLRRSDEYPHIEPVISIMSWSSWLIIPVLLIDIMQRASALRSRILAATQAAAVRVPAELPKRNRPKRRRRRAR